MTARVAFTAGFSRRYTGGVREFCAASSRQWTAVTPASASTSNKKPPSQSTA